MHHSAGIAPFFAQRGNGTDHHHAVLRVDGVGDHRQRAQQPSARLRECLDHGGVVELAHYLQMRHGRVAASRIIFACIVFRYEADFQMPQLLANTVHEAARDFLYRITSSELPLMQLLKLSGGQLLATARI